MVGEIRDLETAEIASQAALTGHLVFSTLHTNDAVSSITRLADMGIQPFLIASSVIGVVAQRLVRKICEHCKAPTKIPAVLLKELGIDDPHATFFEGKGCEHCKQTKYQGRMAIHELFIVTDEMRKMIVERASRDDIAAAARKQGMKTLREAGIAKAKKGLTSLEEVVEATMEN